LHIDEEFSYDEHLVGNYLDELVKEMHWLCKQMVKKLKLADERMKRRHD
jgi:hypothetical protein